MEKSASEASEPARETGLPSSCATTLTRYRPPFGSEDTSQVYEVSVASGSGRIRLHAWPELLLSYKAWLATFVTPNACRVQVIEAVFVVMTSPPFGARTRTAGR